MKVFIATLGTETNTFASFPTGLSDFRSALWVEGGIAGEPEWPWTAPQQLWLRRCAELGWETAEGLHAYAEPAGLVPRADYEFMRDLILDRLRAAGPVDAVLLYLHGAMVAEGYDDPEQDLVDRIRAIAGPNAVIGILLDMHAHVTPAFLAGVDAVVLWKLYPHTDYRERAAELFEIVRRTLLREIRPVMALFDCRTMGLFPTSREGPMPGFVADMMAAEGRDGILSLSLIHGFVWADLPIAQARMLAVADGDADIAQAAAERFGRKFLAIRAEAALPFTPFQEGIARAAEAGERQILLADTSDQVGGGAPGDTTHLLRALIERGIRKVAFAPLYDPLAIDICFRAGLGARLRLRIGGKLDAQSGPPLDLDVVVRHLKRDATQGWIDGERIPIGDVAVIEADGIEILLNAKRVGLFSPAMFTDHGISLADKRVIAVKGLYKHTDFFRGICRDQLYLATPGTCNPDWRALGFRRLSRPLWPLDESSIPERPNQASYE